MAAAISADAVRGSRLGSPVDEKGPAALAAGPKGNRISSPTLITRRRVVPVDEPYCQR